MLRDAAHLDNSREGPIVLAVDEDGGCLDIFSLAYHSSCLSPFLWEKCLCWFRGKNRPDVFLCVT